MGTSIKSVHSARFLGIHFDFNMKFETHLSKIITKCNRALNIIKFLRGTWCGSDPSTLLNFYKSFVRSIIDYGSFIYFPTNKEQQKKLERIQYHAIRLAMGYRKSTPTNVLLAESKIMTIIDRTKLLCNNFFLKIISNKNSYIYKVTEDFYCNSLSVRKKKKSILGQCLKNILPFENVIQSCKQYPIYTHSIDILTTIPNIDFSFGAKLKCNDSPNTLIRE